VGHRIPPVAGARPIVAPRSIFTRIVLLSAVLSAVLLAGLWWITDQTIRDSFAASTREGVDVDLTGLVDIYASGGQAELEQRIADRLAMVPIDAGRAHYLLADRAGNPIYFTFCFYFHKSTPTAVLIRSLKVSSTSEPMAITVGCTLLLSLA